MARPPTATEFAEQWAGRAWTGSIRFAVVTADPPESYSKKRRGKSERSLKKFNMCRRSILDQLRSGMLSADIARQVAARDGFAACIRIAAGREELASAIADILRDGNNVWGDELESGVLHLWFYNDPSHWSERFYG